MILGIKFLFDGSSQGVFLSPHKLLVTLGRGGGQLVSVLAFLPNDPISNPIEVYNFSVKLFLKITKKQKEAGAGALV